MVSLAPARQRSCTEWRRLQQAHWNEYKAASGPPSPTAPTLVLKMAVRRKIHRFPTLILSILRTMVKRRSKVQHYTFDDDSDNEGPATGAATPTETHRHLNLAFDGSRVSQTTSFFNLPRSPKRSRPSTPPPPLVDDFDSASIVDDGASEELSIEDLVQRLEALGATEFDPVTSRKRTEGVRAHISVLLSHTKSLPGSSAPRMDQEPCQQVPR